jgi:hypothetical protein
LTLFRYILSYGLLWQSANSAKEGRPRQQDLGTLWPSLSGKMGAEAVIEELVQSEKPFTPQQECYEKKRILLEVAGVWALFEYFSFNKSLLSKKGSMFSFLCPFSVNFDSVKIPLLLIPISFSTSVTLPKIVLTFMPKESPKNIAPATVIVFVKFRYTESIAFSFDKEAKEGLAV